MGGFTVEETINEQQQRAFLQETNLMVTWEQVVWYVSATEQIPAKGITYEEAMDMMQNRGFTACPF